MKLEISLFLILTTVFVMGFLCWNMARTSKTTTTSQPSTSLGFTIPPQLDVAKAATTVNKQTIRNLNRMYGSGKLPAKSDYAHLAASGKVYWNPNVGSWQATSGNAVGYTGVGNPSAMDIKNLNRLYGSGNVPQGSRFTLLAKSNKVGYTGGQWVPNVPSGAPTAAKIVSNQTIRNLNRMYGNGKLPVTSDYNKLAQAGKVYWNPNIRSWQATSGNAVGYTGVGNASTMDVQNLNRMYGNGNVPQGSRLSGLVKSGQVKYVGGRWVNN